jgi:hypothetical protein
MQEHVDGKLIDGVVDRKHNDTRPPTEEVWVGKAHPAILDHLHEGHLEVGEHCAALLENCHANAHNEGEVGVSRVASKRSTTDSQQEQRATQYRDQGQPTHLQR